MWSYLLIVRVFHDHVTSHDLSIHIMWSIPQSRDVQRRKLKTIKYSVRDTTWTKAAAQGHIMQEEWEDDSWHECGWARQRARGVSHGTIAWHVKLMFESAHRHMICGWRERGGWGMIVKNPAMVFCRSTWASPSTLTRVGTSASLI